MKPKESAKCHQTLSLWVGSGDKTTCMLPVSPKVKQELQQEALIALFPLPLLHT